MSVREKTLSLIKELKKEKLYRKDEHKFFYIDMDDTLWGWGHYGDTIHVPAKPVKKVTKKVKKVK